MPNYLLKMSRFFTVRKLKNSSWQAKARLLEEKNIDDNNMSESNKFTSDNEGYKQFPYICSAGKLTVGIGFNLDDVGLSKSESLVILEMRLTKIDKRLTEDLPWFSNLNDARKSAIKDMAYQMGINGLFSFKKSLKLMADELYGAAGIEFSDSDWSRQTPNRSAKVCSMIKTGEFQ